MLETRLGYASIISLIMSLAAMVSCTTNTGVIAYVERADQPVVLVEDNDAQNKVTLTFSLHNLVVRDESPQWLPPFDLKPTERWSEREAAVHARIHDGLVDLGFEHMDSSPDAARWRVLGPSVRVYMWVVIDKEGVFCAKYVWAVPDGTATTHATITTLADDDETVVNDHVFDHFHLFADRVQELVTRRAREVLITISVLPGAGELVIGALASSGYEFDIIGMTADTVALWLVPRDHSDGAFEQLRKELSQAGLKIVQAKHDHRSWSFVVDN